MDKGVLNVVGKVKRLPVPGLVRQKEENDDEEEVHDAFLQDGFHLQFFQAVVSCFVQGFHIWRSDLTGRDLSSFYQF